MLVLGAILRRGQTHGYGVHQDLTAWRADTWTSVKPGSIYHALEKLESQGMIRAAEPDDSVKRGPARTEYTLTDEGKQEFSSLLEAALKNNDFQQLAAGIAFMELLPRRRVLALLEERLASLRNAVAFLRTLPTEPMPTEPSKHPELVGMWVGYIRYAIETTETLIDSLRAGKYSFADDKSDKRGD